MDGKTFADIIKQKEEERIRKQEQIDAEKNAEKDKNLVMQHLHSAESYLDDEKYSQALSEVDIALKLSKDAIRLARTLSLRGEIYYAMKDYAKAMDDQNSAIKENKYELKAYKRRAELFSFAECYDNEISDMLNDDETNKIMKEMKNR